MIRRPLSRPRLARAPRAAAVVLGTCLACTTGSGPRTAEPSSGPLPPPVSAPASTTRAFAEELRNSLNLPALQVAVSVRGKVVAAESVGFADLERRIPVDGTRLFQIGSLTKLLTATAAVRLHQAGLLDLDAPCSRYLAGLPPDKADITPRQLAGHLAGLRHYGRDDFINTTPHGDVTDSLPRILGQPLLAPPGTRYAYSSYGYDVLGAVLQAAAGKEFREVLAEQVLGPLDLTHTQAEESTNPPAGRVRLYAKDAEGRLVDSPIADLTDRWPSGGYLSTAEDMVRFGGGLLQVDYLGAGERELLFTSQRTPDGKETGVGLGWRIGHDPGGRRFVHHGGETVGGRAYLVVYPDQEVSAALLTNLSFAPIGEKEALRLAAPYLPAAGTTRP